MPRLAEIWNNYRNLGMEPCSCSRCGSENAEVEYHSHAKSYTCHLCRYISEQTVDRVMVEIAETAPFVGR